MEMNKTETTTVTPTTTMMDNINGNGGGVGWDGMEWNEMDRGMDLKQLNGMNFNVIIIGEISIYHFSHRLLGKRAMLGLLILPVESHIVRALAIFNCFRLHFIHIVTNNGILIFAPHSKHFALTKQN